MANWQGREVNRRCPSQAGLAGLSTGYAIESRLLQAWGDFGAALGALPTAVQVAPRSDFTGLIRQIQIQLAMRDVDGVSRSATRFFQILSAESASARIPLLILELFESILIRVFLAQGEIDRCLQLLEWLQATAEPGKRFGRLIDAYPRRVLAFQKQNSGHIMPQALDCFAQALALAEPAAYRLRFLEEGPTTIPLLNAVVINPAVADYLRTYAQTLLNAYPENDKAVTLVSQRAADLVKHLTAREFEILALVAAGDSNRTIADKRVMTVSAVKKHTGNIFGKLNVNSRTQAIARACQLGLLPADG